MEQQCTLQKQVTNLFKNNQEKVWKLPGFFLSLHHVKQKQYTMLNTVGEIEYEMKVAKGGQMGTPALKVVMDTSGNEKFTLITAHRYTKNEKVCPIAGQEFLDKHKDNLARVGWNTTSTDVYIRIK